MEGVEGREYGPVEVRTCLEKSAELVTATGDDPGRWEFFAPPSFAAVALFSVAPLFFEDPEVAPHARSLIHGDQMFRWAGPLPLEEDLHVRGRVERVRRRGELVFVSFTMTTTRLDGEPCLEAASTFLMSGSGPALAEPAPERPVPAPEEKGPEGRPSPLDPPPAGTRLPSLPKSASRADLVRYAAATRDWNPIHWDHRAARAAGLPGVVCHGLLMGAWMAQAAARMSARPDPLAGMRMRFREPLPVASPAAVGAEVEGLTGEGLLRLRLWVASEEVERAAGRAEVRR